MVLALALMIVGGLTAAPATALAYPAAPTGVTYAGSTASSFTVSANTSTGASGYRLYASTTKSSVYVVNISQAIRSALFTAPKVTLGSLPYSTATYYYRFAAENSAGKRYSDIYSANLRPSMPTSATVFSGTSGTTLSWSSGPALGFRIAQSTSYDMVNSRVNWMITSQTRRFTPSGLLPGTRYYYQIAAVNGASKSTYSPKMSVAAVPREQSVRVLSYNVLASSTAGTVEGDGPLATWSERRAGVARLIRSAAPDVVAVQEGNGWTTSVEGYGGVRQVDDLAKLITDSSGQAVYALATTEVPPTEHGYFRTGRYILYKKSTYATYGAGGHWDIGTSTTPRFAAYQVLANRTTGARFLFVSVHLSYRSGSDGDTERAAETKSLISQASLYARDRSLRVVYAGDFNSHEGSNHPYDGPGVVFRDAHINDAWQVAQTRVNAAYDSANQNLRTPPAYGRSIDHVYAPAGVALRNWRLSLELTDGKFVGTIPSDHNPLTVDVSVPY